MQQNLAKENVNIGDVVFSWTIKEYQKYERDKRWYFIMLGLGALLVIYAVVSVNYLFALIIVLFAIILLMSDMKEPMEVPFVITNLGIIVGNRFYRFSELNNFWIIYNPPEIKSLYFSFNSFFRHRLQIPLLDYDPRSIREVLVKYLEEDLDKEDEPLSDRLSRIFRIH